MTQPEIKDLVKKLNGKKYLGEYQFALQHQVAISEKTLELMTKEDFKKYMVNTVNQVIAKSLEWV